MCVGRKWSVWGSTYHFTGSRPEASAWNQSAIYTAEGEDSSQSSIRLSYFKLFLFFVDSVVIISVSHSDMIFI